MITKPWSKESLLRYINPADKQQKSERFVGAVCLILVEALVVLLYFTGTASAGFKYTTAWSTYNPSNGAGTAFDGPTFIGYLKSNSNLLIVNSHAGVDDGGNVIVQQTDGTYVATPVNTINKGPIGTATNPNNGNVYVSTYYDSKIYKYTEALGTLTYDSTITECTLNGVVGPYTFGKMFYTRQKQVCKLKSSVYAS
ncbi:MAG: hypothetical protein HQL61_12665 [Magnetococcales bacterium]|uniref:Uncharacterized protein n=1 Tax=Candidatus Magnetobacterium casense TaxID=1455061 RepID=A0ABS6RZG3_9BACT|nr:hypothetical protein [Candidatus Magnetobacterium casensis]MBF0608388.1 hypothetical protein [Nitrospirota bacterium]MBV6341409.1 hypothetical protein [Candidatus Magnetobacterium casensis]